MTMNTTIEAQALLSEHKTFAKKPGLGWILKVVLLAFVFCIGLYALALQIIQGHIITGMRDNVVWGVYIVNFVFILGLSYAGALLAGIFHLARVEWAKPLQRILKLITVFSLMIGPFYILLCLGRPERLFNLFLYPRIQSPIIWDVIAIVTDLIFCIVYMYFTYIKDFALLRDNAEFLHLSKWRQKLYRFLAMGYQNTPEQAKTLNQALDIMAAIIIPTTIIAYSLLAWLFGMNLKVGWHSSIFAPFFVLSAVYSGVALLIVIMWVYRKAHKIEKALNDEHFIYLGFALLVLSLFYGYFYFSDYITDWYNMQKTYNLLWHKYFDFSQYGYHFVISVFVVAFLPMIVIGFPWFRSINSIALTSLLVLGGLWMMRYLMIVPVLETPYLPIQDVRPDWVHYSATWIEWSLTLAGVALFILFFVLVSRLAPIVPVSEMLEKKGENKLVIFYKTQQKLAAKKQKPAARPNHVYSITLFLLALLLGGTGALAQKKTKTRLKAYYEKLPDNYKQLTFMLIKGSGKQMSGVAGAGIKLTLLNQEGEVPLTTLTTNAAGEALLRIEPGYSLPVDEKGYTVIMARYAGHDSLKAAKKKLKFMDLTLDLAFAVVDSVKQITAAAYQFDSLGNKNPVPGLKLSIGVERLYSNLYLQKVKTGTDGTVTIEFPDDIPGDSTGAITVIARVNENKKFGTVTKTARINWGTVVDYTIVANGRSLFGDEAPLWMIISVFIILSGAWFHFILAIVKVLRIKKLVPSEIRSTQANSK